jgi:hypothetical protein
MFTRVARRSTPSSRLAALTSVICAIGLSCGAGQGGSQPPESSELSPASARGSDGASASEREPEAVRSVAESEDMRLLLADLAGAHACSRFASKFHRLSADGYRELTEGRLWIENCEGAQRDNLVNLKFRGRAWRYIDKKSEKLGATFTVNQYARMKLAIELVGKVDVAYERDKHVINLWLSPTEPVRAAVTPLTQIDAKPRGSWSHLLGAFSAVIGQSPDKKATKQLASEGKKKFSKQLTRGYSVALDLCTGQRHEELGDLKEGELPPTPYPPEGRVWLKNEKVRLHPGGIDLTGPFKSDPDRLRVELRVDEGDAVRARLICDSDAAKVASAFLEGARPPHVPAAAERLVNRGKPATLEADTKKCALALYTTPGPGARSAVVFRHMVHADKRALALVPCEPSVTRRTKS